MTHKPTADDRDDLLGQAVDDFFTSAALGEEPDVSDYVRQYPEIADLLKVAIPALMAAEDRGVRPRHTAPQDADCKQRRLGDFRIIRQLGRGGMGIVYEAEQITMQRRVALKVLPLAGLVDELKIRRFQNEVRAVAALDHPNIVPVYMVGEERGVHYYAMQLVRGRSLSEVIASLRHVRDAGDPLDEMSMSRITSAGRSHGDARHEPEVPTELFVGASRQDERQSPIETVDHTDSSTIPHATRREYFRSVAALGIQAATALQHAHDEGVIHRDVKPANLLLDHSAKLYLTDFGLARIEADVGVTMTGDILGTLRYMAPEQALAKRVMVDHRADIYSLAVTLYELLALRPAYEADDRRQLLNKIAFEEPTLLRRIDREIPAELVTIIHKAMSKDVDQRYASAQELADDLRSHLENRPIKAKPPTTSEIIGKWARRSPAVFGAAMLVGGILLVASIVSGILAFRLSIESDRAVQSEQRAIDEAKLNRRLRYLSDVNLAHQLYKKQGDLARATQLLIRSIPAEGEKDLRGFEWRYLWNVCRADHSVRVLPRTGLVEVAFSPDNRTFATGGSNGIVQIWDRQTLKKIEEPWPAAPAPDSQFRRIDVLYSPTGDILAGLFHDGAFGVKGRVVLFDVATGDSWSLTHESKEVIRIGFRTDGMLVTAEADGFVRFWNAATGQPVGSPKQLSKGEKWERAAFTSDFQLVAAGGPKTLDSQPAAGDVQAAKVKVYRVDTGSVESEIEADNCTLGKLQFSVSGRYLINPGNPPHGMARLIAWDVETGQEVFSYNGTEGEKSFGGVTPISTDLVAVGGSNSISFVNPIKAEIIERWQGVPGAVTDLALSADRKQLASAGWDGAVRLWDLPRKENPTSFDVDTIASELSFSPSGDRLVSAHVGYVMIRDTERFQAVHRLEEESGPVFSPIGNMLATISESGSEIRFWNYLSGRQAQPPVVHKGHTVERLAISMDGKWMACATQSGAVFTWETAAPENPRQFQIASSVNPYRYLAFGVNKDVQQLMAIPESNRTVKLVNLETDDEQILSGPKTQIYDVAFSLKRPQLVSCGSDICVWNTDTGELEQTIAETSGAIKQVAFTPDGASIIARGYKGNVSLWDVQSGWEKFRLLDEWDQTPHSVALSPDGNRIVASVNDGALMVWSAPRADSSKSIASP